MEREAGQHGCNVRLGVFIMKKTLRKVLSVILTVVMMISFISVGVYAISDVSDSEMQASLAEAKTYIDALTVNNSSNNPSNVVPKFGTQFTWDNEKRESANKSYLFEWSYYNGVVFEGIEDIYDYTGESTYRTYVENYMSPMITSAGGWAKCTSGNTSKDAAGYVDYHGADCYKTASLLIDMAKDSNGTVDTTSKYFKMATTIYNDLTTGTGSGYSKADLGYNYWHSNWNSQTAPTYKVWLDGIYMIQPFMAEYAYYTNDTAQMSKILQRFQWLYNNDRNSTTGLYYHALNSASNYCNYHWTRAIGWYAMAVVDVMQYMSGSDLDTMKVILKDLVDNMLPYQDASTGMWANLCNKAVTSTNRLETSGTAMMAYAIAKGVNRCWLDSSYAQYAKAAFKGMTDNKLSGSNLSDIYFKASASGSDNYQTTSNYYTNEGKGVGPFIMAYAEVLELYDKGLIPDEPEEPEEPDEPEAEPTDLTDAQTGVTIEGTTASAVTVSDVTSDYAEAFEGRECAFYDITLAGYTQGDEVTVSLPVPSNIKASTLNVYYIPANGNPQEIDFTYRNGKVYFVTNHMSVYGLTGAVLNSGEDPDYPPFPEEGSVKIDKWATGDQLENTGVGEVNLSVVGVPPFYSSSVDVLFVTDVSNSMHWVAGSTTYASETQKSKLNNMQDAVAEFSGVLLGNNVAGDVHNNTISFVTFGGLDKDHEQNTSNVSNWSTYADPTRTLFTSYDSLSAVTSAVNNIKYTTGSSNSVYITFDGSTGSSTKDVSYGGTNYDYGFMEATSAIAQIKADYKAKTGQDYADSNRGIYVIFVTDGAPTHYEGKMYRYDTDTKRPDKNETWINANGQEVVYAGGVNNANYSQSAWYDYIKSTDSTWATRVYNTEGVAGMSALGIDLDNGGFNSWVFTESSGYPLKDFVESIVTDETLDVYLADDSAEIASGLLEMAGQISSAAGSAYVMDTMGAQFNLQMANTVNHTASGSTIALSDYGITPKMTVKRYSCYHIGDVGTRINGVNVTDSMIGQHISETPEIVETVTFNAAGTEAYSSQKSGNIMTNGVINAVTFIYNSNSTAVTVGGVEIPAESICWKLGGLSEDEYVITYNVYLDASMQGGCPAGTYDTNEEAVLYYKNYLGNDCEIEYPVPQLSWEDAKLSYELYLVDANGNPVNENGARVSFENRTVMSELVEVEKYLNSAATIDYDVLNSLLPDGYMLYNEDASYTGIISSNDLYNSAVINDSLNSTFVFDPTGTTIGSNGKVNGITDYTDIKVAFAIVKLGLNPDAIVLDYGKTITVDPLANDVGSFVINGLTTEAPRAGLMTSQSVKTANSVLAVEAGQVDTNVTVPLGKNVVRPFAMAGVHYVYPDLYKAGTSNDTTALRYEIDANGRVTKYAANRTNGTQLAASLADGGYVIDGSYAITNLGGMIYVLKDYELDTTTTETYVDREYYAVGANTSKATNITGSSSSNCTTMITLIDGTVIKAYRSGTSSNRTIYIYEGNTRKLTMGTSGTAATSGSFTHTLTGYKDIDGNNITITLSFTRSGKNSTNVTVSYPDVTKETTQDKVTDTVNVIKTGYKTGNDVITYSLFSFLNTVETVYYYASPESEPARNSDSSTLLYSTIKVIPATSVYYEDDFGGSEENGGLYIRYTGNWSQINDEGVKTTDFAANTDISDRQDNGEIGTGNGPYNYDSSYENCTKFSNGTAMTVNGSISKVDGKNQFDAYAEFSFTGTGFDIISRTDMDCGMITLAIYNSDDELIDNVPVLNKGVGTLYQIPVISYTGLDYGTYRVKINVNAPQKLLGITGCTFYLDAIRIFNPLGFDNADGLEAYLADKQANEYEASIRDYILSIGDIRTSETAGAVYVDTIDNEYSGGGILDQSAIKDFKIEGPNEEVYLTPGKGIGFALVCSSLPESVQLAIKLPKPVDNAKILVQTIDENGNPVGTAVEKTVTSSTEMFYDITDAVTFTQTTVDGAGYYRAVVILTNALTGDAGDIISITNVKMTYSESVRNIVEADENELQTASVGSAVIGEDGEVQTVEAGLMASWNIYCDAFRVIDTQYKAVTPNYDVTAVSGFEAAPKGLTSTAQFATSQFVDGLVVTDENGNEVSAQITSSVDESKLYTEESSTAKTWTVTVNAAVQGEHTYTVSAANGEGTAAEAALTVLPAKIIHLTVVKYPSKTEYTTGERIDDTGLVLEATYSDGTVKRVNSGYALSTEKAKGTGEQKVYIVYDGLRTSYTVTVTFDLAALIRNLILSIFSFSWLRNI